MFVSCILPALLWLTLAVPGEPGEPGQIGETVPDPIPVADETPEEAAEETPKKAKGEKDPARAALRKKMQELASAILEHEIRMAKLKALTEVYDARGNDARVAEVIELERRENERFEAQVLVFRAELPKEVLAHVDTSLRDPGASSKAAKSAQPAKTSGSSGTPGSTGPKGGAAGAKGRTGKARTAAAKSTSAQARALPAASKKNSAGESKGPGKAGAKAKAGGKPRGGLKAAAAKRAQAPLSKQGRAAKRTLNQQRIREVLSRAGRSRFLLGTRQPSLGKRDR